jgi:hypothetical protein
MLFIIITEWEPRINLACFVSCVKNIFCEGIQVFLVIIVNGRDFVEYNHYIIFAHIFLDLLDDLFILYDICNIHPSINGIICKWVM